MWWFTTNTHLKYVDNPQQKREVAHQIVYSKISASKTMLQALPSQIMVGISIAFDSWDCHSILKHLGTVRLWGKLGKGMTYEVTKLKNGMKPEIF